MLQNHLGQYERGEFRSKFSQKLQNFVTQLLKIAILIKKEPILFENWWIEFWSHQKINDFVQKQPKIFESGQKLKISIKKITWNNENFLDFFLYKSPKYSWFSLKITQNTRESRNFNFNLQQNYLFWSETTRKLQKWWFRSKKCWKLQNLFWKSHDFDQKQLEILKNWGRFVGMNLLLVNLGWGQLWFTVVVNSKY